MEWAPDTKNEVSVHIGKTLTRLSADFLLEARVSAIGVSLTILRPKERFAPAVTIVQEAAMNNTRPSRNDRTDSHRGLQRQYSEVLQQLHQSHAEFDHFVRALSHDMSANFMLLDGSFGRLKGLLANTPQPEVGEALAHVDACLRESKRFLDDLVGLAKTGKAQMEPARVEVGRVLDEVLFEQRDVLRQRNVRVEIRRPLPGVWCNELRLKQVLTNLIRNAVRHGCDPQEPLIVVSTAENWTGRPGNAQHRLVAIRVHDNGPGIDPKYQEEVFLPGRRLPAAVGDGSGMGLAIAKKVVEHYGGSIRVDSACRHGTAIVFSLPPSPEMQESAQPELRAVSELGGRSVGRDAPHQDLPVPTRQVVSQPWSPRSRPRVV